MRILIQKTDKGQFDVFIKRTRREETVQRPEMGVPKDQLSEAVLTLAKKTRGEGT